MRIAITGSSGLIGSAVRRRLAVKHSMVTVGRSEGADQRADFADPASVDGVDLGGCDALVHCAGIVDEDFADPGKAFRQATLGMNALVRRAKAAGVPRIVYVSSVHIYGPLTGNIDENSPPNPLHDYAIAHFASEQTLRRATNPGLLGLAVRPCAVFGIPPDFARFRRWGLTPFGFPKAAVEKGEIVLASYGRQRRNFVGTEDVASAIDRWLEQERPAAEFMAVNPIGNQTMSIFDFAQLCGRIAEKITGRPCRVTRPESPETHAETFEYTSIHDFARGEMDLAATIELLSRMLAGA
jgi:UDP-glucose 4-epimerase